MPIKFTGNHTCEKCKKSFEWSYFDLPKQRTENAVLVDTIPENKTLVHTCTANGNNGYNMEVNCPYCDYDNFFKYTESDRH